MGYITMIKKIKSTMCGLKRRFTPICGNEITVQWHCSSNFGDILSKYITEKLSGKLVALPTDAKKQVHYMVTGSILSLATSKSIVWGAGIAYHHDKFESRPKNILMVRGEYSRELCQKYGFDSNITLGDPGYIMSKIYTPKIPPKRYRLGVIPHWVDYKLSKHIFSNHEDVRVINLLNDNIEEVIDEIVSCEQCISSSLHGIVVAHSYAIPCLHVTFSDRLFSTGLKEFDLAGDGIKFLDYFSSVGIKEYTPIEISHMDQVLELEDIISPDCGDLKHIEEMITSCPFSNEVFR
jgi:pyruvyltransferase